MRGIALVALQGSLDLNKACHYLFSVPISEVAWKHIISVFQRDVIVTEFGGRMFRNSCEGEEEERKGGKRKMARIVDVQ